MVCDKKFTEKLEEEEDSSAEIRNRSAQHRVATEIRQKKADALLEEKQMKYITKPFSRRIILF